MLAIYEAVHPVACLIVHADERCYLVGDGSPLQAIVRESSESKRLLKFTNGSEILFGSADNLTDMLCSPLSSS